MCVCVCVCVRACVRVCVCACVGLSSSGRLVGRWPGLGCFSARWVPGRPARSVGVWGWRAWLWLSGLGVWWGVFGPAGGLTLVPATPQKDAFGLEGLKFLFVLLRPDALPHGETFP